MDLFDGADEYLVGCLACGFLAAGLLLTSLAMALGILFYLLP